MNNIPSEGSVSQIPTTDIQKTNQNKPVNKNKRNWQLYQLFVRKQFDECMQIIEKNTKESNENHFFSLFLKGLIIRSNGDIVKSLDELQKCHHINQRQSECLKQISRNLFLMGKTKQSMEIASEASQLNPNDWELFYTMGQCYLNSQDYEKALHYFKQANQMGKHDSTYIELGRLYTLMDQFPEAIKVYTEALENSLQNTEIMTILGLMYLRIGQNMEAFKFLGQSLSIDTEDSKSILAVCSIMQDRSEYDAALLRYRIMAQNNPNSPHLWNNIGMCFFGQQKLIAAISCLKKALYLDPFEWITLLNLGLVYLASFQYATAFHYFNVSINLRPDFSGTYMYLGLCLNKLNDFPNAVIAFEKGIAIDQQIFVIALVSRGQEHFAKAKEMMIDFEQKFSQIDQDTRVSMKEVLQQREMLSQILDLNFPKLNKQAD